MTDNKKIISIIMISAIFMMGASTYHTLLEENQANIQKISIGQTKEQVVQIMGTKEGDIKSTHVTNPYSREIFTKGTDQYEILYYLTRKYPAFTPVKRSQATPIVIKNGKVVGVGNEAVKALGKVQ